MTAFSSMLFYPLVLRIPKRFFGLRDFFAVNLTAAPIIGLINVNVFGFTFGMMETYLIKINYAELLK